MPRSGFPYALPEGLSVPSLTASLQPGPGLVGAAVLALEAAVDGAPPGLLPEVGDQQQLGARRRLPRVESHLYIRVLLSLGRFVAAPCRPGSSSLPRTAGQKKSAHSARDFPVPAPVKDRRPGWTGGEVYGVGLHDGSIVPLNPAPTCAPSGPYSGRSGWRPPPALVCRLPCSFRGVGGAGTGGGPAGIWRCPAGCSMRCAGRGRNRRPAAWCRPAGRSTRPSRTRTATVLQERGRAWRCSRSGPSPAIRRWCRGLTASRRQPATRGGGGPCGAGGVEDRGRQAGGRLQEGRRRGGMARRAGRAVLLRDLRRRRRRGARQRRELRRDHGRSSLDPDSGAPVGVEVFDAAGGRLASLNREARRIVESLRTPGRSSG